MHKPFIYSLIPRQIPVETEWVKGKLQIEGNMEHNYIRFRFCYTDPGDMAPLAVSVNAAGKKHIFTCIFRDYSKHEVQTAVFHPEFSVNQQFFVSDVKPLAEFVKNKSKLS